MGGAASRKRVWSIHRPDGPRMSRAPTPKSHSPMSMKNRRGNREAKKPKQNKPKVAVSASPYAAVSSNPAKAAAVKRK